MMKPLLEHYLSPENHIAEQPLMINGHPQKWTKNSKILFIVKYLYTVTRYKTVTW